ncbi:MAG: hypothetical protein KGH64_06610, partial [Candidatus Micrarchaeota archaeon]|nr:hypothetical protein [Candidatus Micrarchaeota archaeon]
KVGQPETEEIWELSKETFFYCPYHGKCPAIIDQKLPNGAEIIKHVIISPMFFCKKCGMVKFIDVWGNSSGLTEGEEITFSSPSLKAGVSEGAD